MHACMNINKMIKESFLCPINLHVPITFTAASVPQAQKNDPTLPDTSD